MQSYRVYAAVLCICCRIVYWYAKLNETSIYFFADLAVKQELNAIIVFTVLVLIFYVGQRLHHAQWMNIYSSCALIKKSKWPGCWFFFWLCSTLLFPVQDHGVSSLVNRETLLDLRSSEVPCSSCHQDSLCWGSNTNHTIYKLCILARKPQPLIYMHKNHMQDVQPVVWSKVVPQDEQFANRYSV